MKPDNFILYYSQWPALKELSAQELGVLLQAIFRTMGDESVDDILTSLEGKVRMAFQFLMVQIKYDNEKYQKKCELNRQKALKRWGKDANDATAYLAMHNNNNNKDNNSNNNKDNNSNNNKDNNSNNNKNNNQEVVGRINSSSSSSTVSDAANGKEEEDEEDNFSKMIEEKFMPWWNQLVKDYDSNIKPLRMMTEKRIKRLRQICDTYGKDILFEVCRKAFASPFLNGRNAKNRFIATFDWIIDEKNFLNVLEGNFYTK